MAVSKDIEKGTWTSQVWVEDWQGKKKHKKKRGFATKKEALEWEHSILLAAKADMNMKLADFVDLYFRDKETELKARTVRNKRYMIEQHVVPMLGDKPMDGITPVDIIQWQNYIRSKGFKETYQRMLQNQLTALFTHATKIYNLKDNPCAKVKRIGKADADKKRAQTNLENLQLEMKEKKERGITASKEELKKAADIAKAENIHASLYTLLKEAEKIKDVIVKDTQLKNQYEIIAERFAMIVSDK